MEWQGTNEPDPPLNTGLGFGQGRVNCYPSPAGASANVWRGKKGGTCPQNKQQFNSRS